MYKCTDCEYSSLTWFGKCPKCGGFNIQEVADQTKKIKGKKYEIDKVDAETASSILKNKQFLTRLSSGFSEIDNVLNGIVEGGVYLVGGEPGVGKTTLVLQILGNLAKQGYKSVYVTAEESKWQVASRAKRVLGKESLDDIVIIATNDLVSATANIADDVDVIVFDSMQAFQIQGNTGITGGVSQVRDVVYHIVRFAKEKHIPAFIIGQVTKEGMLAGPKLAEHIVDVVAYLEKVDVGGVRLMRVVKNRYGEVGNIGFIRLGASGFVDAPNAYQEWIDADLANKPGVGYGVVMYGVRPIVIQVQSLLVDSRFANPKRVAEGISRAKLEVLIAVVDKHVKGVHLSSKDIFVKVIGGLNIKDSCIDLAIVASLISSYKGKSFGKTAFVGEVGLLGDIKNCALFKSYEKEAKKLGFKIVKKGKGINNIYQLPNIL